MTDSTALSSGCAASYGAVSHSSRVVSITSGKGGVGKTNITANLAYILSRKRKKTMVLDADTGLANIDIILGLTPMYNLHHVLTGEKTLEEVIVRGPGGILVLPAASGIGEMADLTRGQKLTLLDELNALKEPLDFVLMDTAHRRTHLADRLLCIDQNSVSAACQETLPAAGQYGQERRSGQGSL